MAAETLLVAWRHRDQAPAGGAVRLWLYGIARRVVANQIRSGRRQEHLVARLRAEPAPVVEAEGAAGEAWDALRRMRPADREILTLVAVEGRSSPPRRTSPG